MSEEKVNAVLIFEIVGRPPEHLVETLKNIVETFGKEKGVSIISKNINEPVLMKDNKEFYTTFAEVEVETENHFRLLILMFKYMPAHIQVVSPEKIPLSNNEFSDIMNELSMRLHAYDEIARMMQIENQNLMIKMKESEEGKKFIEEVKEENKESKKKGRK